MMTLHRQYIIHPAPTQNMQQFFKIPSDIWCDIFSYFPSNQISKMAVNNTAIFSMLGEISTALVEKKFMKTESSIIWRFFKFNDSSRQDIFNSIVHFINLSYVFERSQFSPIWYKEQIGPYHILPQKKHQCVISRQIISVLGYYNFSMPIAVDSSKLKEPVREKLFELLSSHGIVNKHKGESYFFAIIHNEPLLLKIIDSLIDYEYTYNEVYHIMARYNSRSMSKLELIMELMSHHVEKDVIITLSTKSLKYKRTDIQNFLEYREIFREFNITEECIASIAKYPLKLEAFLYLIKKDVFKKVAFFIIDNYEYKVITDFDNILENIIKLQKNGIEEYSLLDYITHVKETYNPNNTENITNLKESLEQALKICSIFKFSQISLINTLRLLKRDYIQQIKKNANINLSSIRMFSYIKPKDYILYLSLSKTDAENFERLYAKYKAQYMDRTIIVQVVFNTLFSL